MKKIIVLFIIGIGIYSLLNFLPSIGPLLISLRDTSDLDEKVDRLLKDKDYLINRPVFEVPFFPVSKSVKESGFDCQNYALIPDKTQKYLCLNLYQTNEDDVQARVKTQDYDRLFLFGQYTNFDCFLQSDDIKDPARQCYQVAKFMDNWQYQKLTQLFDLKPLSSKLYYYLTSTLKQTQTLCRQSDPSLNPEIGGCVRYTQPDYLVIAPAEDSFYLNGGEGLFFQRYATTDAKPITYKSKFALPHNCHLFDSHEIIHAFHASSLKSAPPWFDEGLIHVLSPFLYRQICPPGISYSDVRLQVADNKYTPSPDFDPDSVNLNRPMSGILVQISQDQPCRQGIFIQMARDLKIGGTKYLTTLHSVFNQIKITSESSAAKAVWKASPDPVSAKNFLTENQCSF